MIIFLDIDGVLITHREIRNNSFNKLCVKNINALCDLYENSSIVVISMWRLGRTVEQLQELFLDQGVTSPVIDKTKDNWELMGEKPRGQEVLDWISDNNYQGQYIVVDDEIADIKGHIPIENILWVENGLYKRGFTEERLRDWKKKKLKYLKNKSII